MFESSDPVFSNALSSQWFNVCLYFVLTTIMFSLILLIIFKLEQDRKLINKISLDHTIDNQTKMNMIKFYNKKAKMLRIYFGIDGVIIFYTLSKFILSLIGFN